MQEPNRTTLAAGISDTQFLDKGTDKQVTERFTVLLQQVRQVLRLRHYSIHTQQAYESWICRYLAYHGCREPAQLGAEQVKQYLAYLADRRQVAASTQNQALCALVFLYGQVLGTPLGDFSDFSRAKRPQRLPTVLSEEETARLLAGLTGVHALVAELLYGSGLRIQDALRLRVKDIDFDYGQILVRDGKGQKDRVTVLAESAREPLRQHLVGVKALFEADRQAGVPGVYIWPAYSRPL